MFGVYWFSVNVITLRLFLAGEGGRPFELEALVLVGLIPFGVPPRTIKSGALGIHVLNALVGSELVIPNGIESFIKARRVLPRELPFIKNFINESIDSDS